MNPDLLREILAGINIGIIPAVLTLAYLIAKIAARGVIRTSMNLTFDLRDTVSWFPVDLNVIAISLSANAQLQNRLPKGTSSLWYSILILLLFGCVCAYAIFHKLRGKEYYAWSWLFLFVSGLCSVTPFVTVLRLIGEIKAP